ncbi:cyclic 3',5'-adenosine monophosphate phosphodiesterase [bacterium BMS3Abin01]|nr:cyclic 3',5'-adenosine monophosphate phosphodiesterase [bacterium BMS3Abin01]
MPEARDYFQIAQFSDIHCGDARFDSELMRATVDEINQLGPDLTVVAGDLTADGYREQFSEAKKYIDQLECDQVLVMAGNHDCRNVGFLHFEEMFGPRRSKTLELDFHVSCDTLASGMQERIRILALDSNKPDLNDGEVGRDHYSWIDDQFPAAEDYKIFILHHHLVGIPGTGRERNVVWDAGDVLERLRMVKVDLVLCGHRHVPYTWPLADMLIISSGTASTWRTRGFTQPSYNIIRIDPDAVIITTRVPGGEMVGEERFLRRAHMEPV